MRYAVARHLGPFPVPPTLVTGSLALFIGASVAIHPVATAVLTVSCTAVLLARRFRHGFLILLMFLLAGYAFLGRGFGHLGVWSLYVGEVVLAFGLLSALFAPRKILFSAATVPVLAFMTWGVMTTLPYLSRDGIDALRDAVLWGYGAFAFLVIWLLDRPLASAATSAYRRLVTPFLLWAPVAVVVGRTVELPAVAGTSVSILDVKLGDVGVHLAGIAAFLLLGLHGRSTGLTVAVRTMGYLSCLALVAILNRGGLLAAAVAFPALAFARPSRRWLVGGMVGLVLLSTAAVVDPLARVQLGTGRFLSIDQIGQNLSSVFADAGRTDLEETRAFRLNWWAAVVDYTVFGPHFWTGKGFGVNLGIDDGFPTSVDDPARDPHNTHLTILARMGVPGLVLWLVVLGTFATAIVRAFLRARATGADLRARVLAWIFLYWLAMLVNTSFDPYLSGPMGGIWFWSLFGYGLAVAGADDWFRPRRA